MNESSVVALALVLVACSAPPVPSEPDAGADAHAKDSAALDVAVAPDDSGPAKITVSGDVVDMQGAPWANAKVQVCSSALCTLGNADGSGAFAVQVPAGNHYHVIARPPPSDPREGSAGLGVLADALVADTTLASPVPIPITGAHASLAAPAAVTTDLTLTANAADVAFNGSAYFSGVSVEQAKWPAFVVAGKTILAMWALDPWGTRTNPGKTIAVTIANSFGLAPGDIASVYAVNETTAELGTPTQATVSTDGATLSGATLDRVTWVVLAH
jgi:hypothetical protein